MIDNKQVFYDNKEHRWFYDDGSPVGCTSYMTAQLSNNIESVPKGTRIVTTSPHGEHSEKDWYCHCYFMHNDKLESMTIYRDGLMNASVGEGYYGDVVCGMKLGIPKHSGSFLQKYADSVKKGK